MRSTTHLAVARRALVGAAATLVLLGSAAASADPLPIDPVGAPLPPLPGAGAHRASAAPSAAGEPMVGTFRLTAGTCSGSVKGSYFRMIQPGGSGSGPFVTNSDSPCSDQGYTPMAPGTDGGLVTGAFQAQPSPAFDGAGNGLAARITKPQKFFGADFASSTNATDPQTGTKVAAPAISVDGSGKLTGDLRAFAAAWNGQNFNQGAPKPDGSTPGLTAAPTGTFNTDTKAFVLDWTSQIVGGPFNNFTGQWHFEGTFDGTHGGASAPTTTGGGSPADTPAVVAGTGAATTGSAAQQGTGSNLANTGLSAATDRGLLALGGGLLGLTLLGRARRMGTHVGR